MIKYEPVPLEEHDALIGADFNERFTKEMHDYYAPYQKKGRPVNIGKETWEYAVSDSIDGGEWVGAGKNVIDVCAPNLDIDVKGISCSKITGITSEASILQNVQEKNDHAVQLFKQGNYNGLKEMFIDPFIKKTSTNKNLHVLCTVRDKQNSQVWYCLLKVVKHENPNLVEEMTARGTRSIDIPLIDPEYGRTYLAIQKRRLELRLNMAGMSKYSVCSHSI